MIKGIKAVVKLMAIAWNVVMALILVEVINPPMWWKITMAVVLLLCTGISIVNAGKDVKEPKL